MKKKNVNDILEMYDIASTNINSLYTKAKEEQKSLLGS